MLKSVLILAFWISAFLSLSQNNFMPLEFGSTWRGYWTGNMDSGWLEYSTGATLNDTSINNQTYHKLFIASNSSNKTYFCGFRSDSIEKSIYIIPSDSIQEYLFFDFDSLITEGDQIDISYYGFGEFKTESCEFLTLDSVLINGYYYKNWYFSCFDDRFQIISEHFIGLYNFPFQAENYEWWVMEMKCYMEHNISIFGNCPFNYDDVAGIHEKPALELTVYPNPAKEIIYFETEINQEISIELRTITGELVFESNELINRALDLSTYNNGVYILIIKSEHGVKSQKIIKQ